MHFNHTILYNYYICFAIIYTLTTMRHGERERWHRAFATFCHTFVEICILFFAFFFCSNSIDRSRCVWNFSALAKFSLRCDFVSKVFGCVCVASTIKNDVAVKQLFFFRFSCGRAWCGVVVGWCAHEIFANKFLCGNAIDWHVNDYKEIDVKCN